MTVFTSSYKDAQKLSEIDINNNKLNKQTNTYRHSEFINIFYNMRIFINLPFIGKIYDHSVTIASTIICLWISII